MNATIALGELELDALTELVNLGAGRAARSLRDMVGEEVFLSVPSVAVVDRAGAISRLRDSEPDALIAVHQSFEGEIAGRALLIFPQTRSLELVRAVTGGDLSLEDIIELEPEALAETGNIILNGCLATIANMLQRSLRTSLPEILRGEGRDIFAITVGSEDADVVLFFYIHFAVRSRDLRGYIAMVMDMPSMAALKQLLVEFIERSTLVEPANSGVHA